MSVFINKQVFLVSDGTAELESLRNKLKTLGVNVIDSSCLGFKEKNKGKPIDLIIFDHTHDGRICPEIKKLLDGSNLASLVPVFTLVNNTTEEIQSALSEGAADYITVGESTNSVLQKIEAIFSEDSGSSIDITSSAVEVTTKGIKVFVVEDDPLLRNLLSLRFDKSLFPYEFSNDGKDIVPVIKQFKPNIIILDIMLPGRTGFEVLEEIKSSDELRKIPVIIFSNRDGAEDRKKAKELGANEFFVKAMTDLSELIGVIEKLVNK